MLVVTLGFRSQRSSLVYHAVLGPAGITVSCVPLFGEKTPKNWTQTWHGIQDVTEQWLKLQHYCCLVKPFGLRFCINPDMSPRLEHHMAGVWRGIDFKKVLNGLTRLAKKMHTLKWQAVDGRLKPMS
jgi:hypothetical protein